MGIQETVGRWHEFVEDPSLELLGDLLSDDVVFHSPVVFTPQLGKPVTTMYLWAASQTLMGGEGEDAFRYTKEVLAGHHAVLEFETTIDGMFVNGVDIITVDDAGRIVEFRVMIRPLKGVNAVHAQMKAMLELLKG